jgi:glycerol-3-phosphate dehydrogenase (NAD(P)+)
MSSRRVAVIGDGGWGTALALVAAQNGHEVCVWGPFADYIDQVRETRINSKFLPDVELPETVSWTADRTEAVAGADLAVWAIPSQYYRAVCSSFKGLVPESCSVVSVAKGLDRNTHQRMTEIAEEELGVSTAALSGPSHAEEVARGIPTCVVTAGRKSETARFVQEIFNGHHFRVYTSDDIVGVELGGALKNVIALAVGISDGIGFGDNTKAALITRGLAEMSRLGCSMGADPQTFAGLSGMGDLIVTCASRLSRNRAVGERIGKGETLKEILASMEQVAEGVWNCSNAYALADRQGVEVPITAEVYAVLQEEKDPRQAVHDLLARDPKPEHDG